VAGDLTWVKCHHDSPCGRIVSNWQRKSRILTMEVTIPAITTATVHIPAKDAAGVTESNSSSYLTSFPEDLKKRAGTFSVLLPHGRDE
jgi:hypothetical protein